MNANPQDTALILVAAGHGTRAGGDLPKQWQTIAGRRVIDWTLAAFDAIPDIDRVVVVVHADSVERVPAGAEAVVGGDTRAASVRAGLEALGDAPPTFVLIHDAARACVSPRIIGDVLDALGSHDGAAPGLAVSDALWQGDGVVQGVRPRDGLFRAQTPQGFHYAAIRDAHAAGGTDTAADDVELAVAAGLDVAIVPGEEDNLKITTPGDFARAERILAGRGAMDIRVGNGFDVHAFGPGNHVTLCGIDVAFDKGLSGHSDADVGMHAITDAIYGALADGDIGQHFPPSDPQWKGAASDIFLKHAVGRASARGYAISNVDCTLICEMPKIGPHADAMRARLAEIMGLETGQVSVKATTSEQLGFTGRGEGIAALASATLVKA